MTRDDLVEAAVKAVVAYAPIANPGISPEDAVETGEISRKICELSVDAALAAIGTAPILDQLRACSLTHTEANEIISATQARVRD